MGIYEYQCGSGHISERFVSLAERPDHIPCTRDGCGKTASRCVSAVKTTFHHADRKAIKRSGR
jgi:hypothetical protein